MIKLGIIGTGWITHEFVKAAISTGKYCLTAVYSRKVKQAEAFGKEFGAVYFEDQLEVFMQSDQFDTVYIASPNSLHFFQGMLAAQCGKNIIVEKPAFSNEYEMEQIQLAVTENKVLYFEAARHVHEENFAILKEKIKALGEIKGANFTYMKYSSRYDAVLKGEEPNIFSLQYSGGALADLGVYLVYAAIDLFGVPVRYRYYPRVIETGADGSGTILFGYQKFDLVMNVGKVMNSHLESEIYGSKGTIELDQINDIRSIRFRMMDGTLENEWAKEAPKEIMSQEAEAFAQIILNRECEESANKYRYFTKLSVDVNRIMSNMRKEAGIIYPADRK